jgi:multidrug transporter EmrE-like cation transporter
LTASNYLSALVLSLLLSGSPGILASAAGALRQELAGLGSGFPSVSWPVLAGMPAGVLYLMGMVWYQKSVAAAGIGLTAGFGKLGVLLPVAASALIWREVPSGLRLAGMLAALVAIVTGALSTRRGGRMNPALLIFFFVGGLAEFSSKLFQQYSRPGTEGAFLAVVFGTAFICSLAACRPRPRLRPVLAGLALGIPNMLVSFFIVRSLRELPGPLVFSAFPAGTIALLGLSGTAFFGERRSGSEWCSITAAIVALVLVNLG